MAVYEHSEPTTAPPPAVWALWSEVSRWPEWDTALASASLRGPFAVGSRGRLRPTGGPPSSFRLSRVETGVGFTETSRLPLARLRVEHDLLPGAGGAGTVVRHRVVFAGPLGGPWSRLLGARLGSALPATVRRVVALAEARGS